MTAYDRDQVYTTLMQRRGVPEHLQSGLLRYFMDGYLPGDFLCAVITNDLTDAVQRADDVSMAGLKAIVQFLYNDAPIQAWGSRAKVEQWCDLKRGARKGGESHG